MAKSNFVQFKEDGMILKIPLPWFLIDFLFTDYKGPMVDPYNCDCNLIRNQNHIVDLPENVEDMLHYNGQIQMNLTNGDIFSGNFEDGEREGFGVLTFGLIHKR